MYTKIKPTEYMQVLHPDESMFNTVFISVESSLYAYRRNVYRSLIFLILYSHHLLEEMINSKDKLVQFDNGQYRCNER